MANTEQLRSFIVKNYYVPDPAALKNETSLLDHGIIDSTGIMELTAFLEENFGIKVLDEELLPENLESINNINSYLARKLTKH